MYAASNDSWVILVGLAPLDDLSLDGEQEMSSELSSEEMIKSC